MQPARRPGLANRFQVLARLARVWRHIFVVISPKTRQSANNFQGWSVHGQFAYRSAVSVIWWPVSWSLLTTAHLWVIRCRTITTWFHSKNISPWGYSTRNRKTKGNLERYSNIDIQLMPYNNDSRAWQSSTRKIKRSSLFTSAQPNWHI